MRAGPQLAVPPLMMLTMGEACDGSCLRDLPDPLDGRIRSTPLEAAPAVESLEREDNEYIALSGDLVVEVRGVVPGDLDLELTIRMSDECGDAHEVCGAGYLLLSCHPKSRTVIRVIRENPASRGTETSAEVLVGPPWRMESNAGQQQWY